MIILQSTVPNEVTSSFIKEWGAYGGFLILLVLGIGFLIKYIKTENTKEKERLIKSEGESTQKVEILYNELKEMQEKHAEKQTDILLKNQEIQTMTVDALNKTSDALNNNSKIFGKLIEKL